MERDSDEIIILILITSVKLIKMIWFIINY